MRKMIRTQMEVEVEVELLGIPGQRPAVYSQFIICLVLPLVGMKQFYKCVTRAADICRTLTFISHCKITQFHRSEFLNIYIFFCFADTASYICPFRIDTGLFLDFQTRPQYLHGLTITSTSRPLPAAMSTRTPSTAVRQTGHKSYQSRQPTCSMCCM